MRVYVVQRGDTLYRIARRFGVTVEEILAVNPQITDPDQIQVGQAITIPDTAPAQPPGATRYVVQPGDTMYKIAQRFGVDLQDLIRANPQISDPSRIQVGQVIFIPVEAPVEVITYVVQPGDTMFKIARAFNVTLDELIAANPQITDPARLIPGQIAYVPTRPVAPGIVRTNIPYSHAVMMEDLQALQDRFPFIQMTVIGYSVLAKELPAIRLGTGTKEVHYNGAHHANEWITSPLLMKFVEDFSSHYEEGTAWRGFDIRSIYRTTSIWVVPMVNPDGVEIVQQGITPEHPFYRELLRWNAGSTNFDRWKANIRGVDLNRQYRANWELARQFGSDGPAPYLYAGPAPESEPESKAVANFTRTHVFRLVIAYHTQGQVIYWNYLNEAPPEAAVIVNEFARLSGYLPISESPEEASHAGYKDWFVLAYKRPGFTVEVGRGVNPLPIDQFPQIYNNNIGIMLYAATV